MAIILLFALNPTRLQAQTTPASPDSTILSREQFHARVAARELRAAFRLENRIVVREEVSGAAPNAVTERDEHETAPGLVRRRVVMISVSALLVIGAVAAKLARRRKASR